MRVLLLQIRLRLPSRNLKEKRAIVKSILGRSRNRFNIACTESELHDQAGDAELAFVTVAQSAADGRRIMQKLEEWILEERPDLEVADLQVDEL